MSANPESAISTANNGKGLLRSQVTWIHFSAFCCLAMVTMASTIFLTASQTSILELLKYPSNQIGSASGTLESSGHLLSLPMALLWGIASDNGKRNLVFAAGLMLKAIASFLYPHAKSVFPTSQFPLSNLLIFRMILAMGMSATFSMLTAVAGDYAAENARSRMFGIVGVNMSVGAILAAFFLNQMSVYLRDHMGIRMDIAIKWSYISVAILLLISSVLAFLSIRVINDVEEVEKFSSQKDFMRKSMVGFKAGWKYGIVFVAYIASFVARSDSLVLSSFMKIWTATFYIKNKIPCGDVVSTKGVCPEATTLAGKLSGIGYTFVLLGAPIFGILGDRLGKLNSVLVSGCMGVISYGCLCFVGEDPRSKVLYLVMMLIGFAEISAIISGSSLLNSLSTTHNRGALAGIFAFFGTIGIIVTSKVGGILFDWIGPKGAFITVAFWNAVLVIFTIGCSRNNRDPDLTKEYLNDLINN